MGKTIKLRDLIERFRELSKTGSDIYDMEVYINTGDYDDIIPIKTAYIASNDDYDYISIETEHSKYGNKGQ